MSSTHVEPRSESVRHPGVLSGLRVLLVEDDPDTSDVVQALLRAAGASVRTASTCDGALRQFQETGCDVVVTDYALPSGTGYQLLRRIRSQPVDAHIPVVGYSAHGDMVPAQEQAAFTAYVPKPAVSGSLVDILYRLPRR